MAKVIDNSNDVLYSGGDEDLGYQIKCSLSEEQVLQQAIDILQLERASLGHIDIRCVSSDKGKDKISFVYRPSLSFFEGSTENIPDYINVVCEQINATIQKDYQFYR